MKTIMLTLLFLIAGISIGPACNSDSNLNEDSLAGDGSSDGDGDADGDANEDREDDYDVDDDGDGFTNFEGDCADNEPMINPNAMEDLGEDGQGDGVDNDCDGYIDEVDDCPDGALTNSAEDLAAAINLCDPRFLLGAERIHSPQENFDVAYDTLDKMGTGTCLKAHQGIEMAVLSTGVIGQDDPNWAPNGIDTPVSDATDPQPEYQGDDPVITELQETCDLIQLKLNLKSPSNATGFSFDFVYASSEYDEWIDQGFNDTFYAIMEYSELNGGATTNIAFDSNGNEIEVDANFFENDEFLCDEVGSGWEPEMEERSGSTGWLQTSKSLSNPGDEFTLTFSIHDEGDCIFDSIVFVDNFKWILGEVDIPEETTAIIVPE